MAFSAGTAVVHVVADSSALAASITSGANNAVARLGSKMQSVGLSMTKFITVPLVALGAVSTKMALDFEQSFAKIGALAGGIGVPLKQAEEQVKKLAHATGQDPGGLANALYFVASAGLDASKVMPVLTASAKAAATGMGDASTIAQLLTSVLHDYEGTGLSAAKAMNILTGAIKVGKAEPADLAENLGTVIPVASQMEVSFQDVAAAIAQATNAGVDAARAVTGLRYLLANFQSPTAKALDVLKDYNLSIGDIQNQLAKPGGLLKVMQSLADTFDLTTVAGKAAWSAITGGARGAIIANTLVGSSAESARQLWDAMGDSAERNSTLFQDAFAKMRSTDAFKFQRLLSDLKTAAIELGETLIPVLVNDIIPAIQKVVRWFKNLDEGTRGTIVKVGLLAAAFGPLLTVFGTVIRVGGNLIGKLISLGTAASGAATAGAGGGGLLAFLASPAGAAIAGVVAGIGGAMLLAADNTRDWNNEVNALITSFRKVPGAIDAAQGKVDDFNDARDRALADPTGIGTLSVGFATAHGAGGGSREVRVARDALEEYRHEMERLVRAQDIANVGTEHWLKTTLKNSELTKKQSSFLASAVAGLDRLGGALKETERRGIANLLAVGDFNGALAILDRAADRASKPLRNMQGAHQQAAEAAADQAQKVRGLNRDIKDLPNNTKVNVDTDVDTSGLTALENKMRALGFRQGGGGEWLASGAMRVRVVGGSPMPAVQMHERIEVPLKKLGFTQKGVDWFMRLYMKVHLQGGEGEGDAFTKLQARARDLTRIMERLGDTVGKALDEAKEKLAEALDKGVGEAAARAAVDTARAAKTIVGHLQRMVEVARAHLDKLMAKFRDFKASIREGFAGFKDLGGIVTQTVNDYLEAVKAWEQAAAEAAASGQPFGEPRPTMDLQSTIQQQVDQAQQLAKLLMEAAEKGLSQGLIQQFAAQGAGAIPALEQLLANPELIQQLNEASAAIAEAAGQTADALGERFFAKAIRHATNRIDNLAAAIVRAIAHIQAAMGQVSAGTAAALAAIQSAAQQAQQAPTGGGGGGGGGGGHGHGGLDPHGSGAQPGGTPPIIVPPKPTSVVINHTGDIRANDPDEYYRKLVTIAQKRARLNAGVTGLA